MTKEEWFYKHPKDQTTKIVHDLILRYGLHKTLGEIQKELADKKMPGFKCPKCQGKGYIVKEYNAYPDCLPDSGWVYKPGYDYQECDLCHGYGYTPDKYEPKTKTEIIGYQKVES